MVQLFLITLWLTFIVIRILTHLLDVPKIEIGKGKIVDVTKYQNGGSINTRADA